MASIERVLFVWPPGYEAKYALPLAFAYLKSSLPATCEARLVDCVMAGPQGFAALRAALAEFRPQVVAVSSWSPMFPKALEAMRIAKAFDPGIVTIFGGVHMTAYGEQVMQNAEIDFGFRGEGEQCFPVFLEELAHDAPDWRRVKGLAWRTPEGVVFNPQALIETLDDLPFPDYAFIRLDDYIAQGYRYFSPKLRNAPILATRGCPYRCNFCAAPVVSGKPVRTHSPDYIARLVTMLHERFAVEWVNFIDDNFTFHVKWCKQVCATLKNLRLPLGFATPNGIRFQRGDRELWAAMRAAGWQLLVIAPESGSPDTIARMQKDIDLATIPGVVDDIRSAGLEVQGFFIIGYPGETEADLRMTRSLIYKCDFDFFALSNFQPIPGTPVYKQLVASGEIEDNTLPRSYSDGVRTYTPASLKGFNFPRFILETWLLFALRRPVMFIKMMRHYDVRMIARKLALNIRQMVLR